MAHTYETFCKTVTADNMVTSPELAKWAEDLNYSGFDPKFIHSLMVKRAADNQRNLNRDLGLLLFAALKRGTKTQKILDRSTDSTLLKEVLDAYSIVSTGGAKPTRETITLGRLMLTYPVQCAQLILKAKLEPIHKVSGLGDQFCFLGGINLIPKDMNLHALWLTWHQEFSAKLNLTINKELLNIAITSVPESTKLKNFNLLKDYADKNTFQF